jgi:predicted transcriptional regulator
VPDMPSVTDCLEIVEKLYKDGVPVKEIAKHCGNSMSTVYKALERLEAMGRVKRRKGRYKGHRRLTEEELKTIEDMYRAGASVYEIAKRLGRPESTIYYALKKLGLK